VSDSLIAQSILLPSGRAAELRRQFPLTGLFASILNRKPCFVVTGAARNTSMSQKRKLGAFPQILGRTGVQGNRIARSGARIGLHPDIQTVAQTQSLGTLLS
jgi:hypothetical protein